MIIFRQSQSFGATKFAPVANVLADGMADHVVVAERSQLRLELLLLAVGWEDAGFGQAAVGQRLLLVVEQQGEEG